MLVEYLPRFWATTLLVVLPLISLAIPPTCQGQAPAPAVVRQIDHVMISTGERQRLTALLCDTLQLPLVWPQPGSDWTYTTGIALGDVNLELVPTEGALDTRLGTLAFQPVALATALDQLRQRGLIPLEPAVNTTDAGEMRWTVINFRHPSSLQGSGFFLIQYHAFDMDERRARFEQILRRRQGGPLGFRQVREFRLAYPPEDLPAARHRWQPLLGDAGSAPGDRFQLTAGPNVVLVQGRGPQSSSLLVEVESLSAAEAAARSLGLLASASADSLVLDPLRFGGLQLILVAK